MIPQNALSTRPITSRFIFPDSVIPSKLTEDYELGGIALQDPSQGLQVQPWYAGYNETTGAVYLRPDITGEPITIFNESGVFELSFAFDQNMRYAAATLLTTGVLNFRWYDTAVASYVMTPYNGITAFKLSHDDKRSVQVETGFSDVLFTYIRDNNLYVRNQRERYLIEHLLQEDLPDNLVITNFGMHERVRMQWRMRYRYPNERLPWLP